AFTVAEVATAEPMSTMSIWLDCRALACADWSRVMNSILSSLGTLPHHLSLCTRVMVLAVLSIDSILNGPPDTFGPFTQEVLNEAGVASRAAGMIGLNSDCQSGYGVLKTTVTSWSVAPLSTLWIWL